MSGSKKKSDSEKGSSSLPDQMKNKEGDPRMPKLGSSNTRSTSGSSPSGSGRSVSSSSSTVLENEFAKNGYICLDDGKYEEALQSFNSGIALFPKNSTLHCSRAAAFCGLNRYKDALKDYHESIRIATNCVQPRQRLGLLLLSLGEVETARSHLVFQGNRPDEVTSLKLKEVTKHIRRCTEARKRQDWCAMLKEAMEATTSGAVVSSKLFACQTEAHLKLRQVNEARFCLLKAWKYDPSAATYNKSKIFGFSSEAYIFYVVALYNVALGQFDTARSAIGKASQLDPENAEVFALREITSGITLFRAGRYEEACSVYDEALATDSMNSFLYCARAACWSKLGEWEKSLADSNQALSILPDNIKALSRRAMSNLKLERWASTVRDFEILQEELPCDEEVAANLSHARVELHREAPDGKVELVSDVEKFQAVIASGESVVYFNELSNPECAWMSSVMDTLSAKYPSVIFLKVVVEQSRAAAENITTLPRFRLYKDGSRVGTATLDVLEIMIKDNLIDPI
ncbi:TPR repeat-containing thioredoxin TTL1-like [Solanum pennellii]|uniref:TPR repeat-containing thioredoxin TTL1-like n=1 Tax=Solanum pennellii TaxID=28526 RepID=A0ABM1UXN5_SOLPN|nr:TPR repeat-containing thioredoxin TTL1-like [Solanum pennellii]